MNNYYSDFEITSPTTVACSGQCYEYRNEFSLDASQMQSGQLCEEYRQSVVKKLKLQDARKPSKAQRKTISRDGILGEVAFAVAYGRAFDPYLNLGAPDFVWNDLKIDVKTSPIKEWRRGYPNLLVAERHYHEDYIYVGIQQIAANKFRLIGWIRAKELKAEWFENPAREDGEDGGPVWIVPFKELHPMKKLIGGRMELF